MAREGMINMPGVSEMKEVRGSLMWGWDGLVGGRRHLRAFGGLGEVEWSDDHDVQVDRSSLSCLPSPRHCPS